MFQYAVTGLRMEYHITSSLLVFTSGGSNNLSQASRKTNIEITVKNNPFTKPDRYSTRPYLQVNKEQKRLRMFPYNYPEKVRIRVRIQLRIRVTFRIKIIFKSRLEN
jgi:hypothetical protein